MLLITSKLAMQLQHTLVKMGHPQSPTLVKTDNLAAYGILTNKIIPHMTKAMDMDFHWLNDQE